MRRAANQTSGTRYATPISRPSSRWKYSHQKMPLNASSDMPLLTCRYSGVARYLSNATRQSCSVSGGSVPTIGCHSVIDSPEWVRRVTPPTTIIAKTSRQQARSQTATARSALPGVAVTRERDAGNAVLIGEPDSDTGVRCPSRWRSLPRPSGTRGRRIA